jgi:hypothetical protein
MKWRERRTKPGPGQCCPGPKLAVNKIEILQSLTAIGEFSQCRNVSGIYANNYHSRAHKMLSFHSPPPFLFLSADKYAVVRLPPCAAGNSRRVLPANHSAAQFNLATISQHDPVVLQDDYECRNFRGVLKSSTHSLPLSNGKGWGCSFVSTDPTLTSAPVTF